MGEAAPRLYEIISVDYRSRSTRIPLTVTSSDMPMSARIASHGEIVPKVNIVV